MTYSLEPACERGEGEGADAFYGCGSQQTCGSDGLLSWVWAHDGSSSEIVGQTCEEPGEAPPAQVAVLTPGRILEAFRRVDVPEPSLTVQPPGGRTLVNFDTIFHTDTEPFRASVQLLGRRVEFDIRPAEFTWRLGDGQTLITDDPGRPWREGLPLSAYVSYRYLEAGEVQLQLETTWTAEWRVGDGAWQPVEGTVTTQSAPQPLEVTTARPQLITYD